MHYLLIGNDLTAWSIALGMGLAVCFTVQVARWGDVGVRAWLHRYRTHPTNSGLPTRRIRNFKQMHTRCIVLGIGVTCETSKRQLLAIADILRETVQAPPDVDIDRAHKAAVLAK